MNTAFCHIDQNVYESLIFSRLPEERIEALRYHLRCCECSAQAYYRAPSRDGRAACFGARHVDGCEQATSGGDGWGDGAEGDRDAILNDSEPIRIDLTRGGSELSAAGAAADALHVGAGRRFGQGEGQHVARPTRRLRPLLRALLETDLSESDRLFEPPGQPVMPAHDFFVPTSESKERGVGAFRGRWGRVLSVGQGQGSIWLNTGYGLSFVLDEQSFALLLQEFNIADKNDLVGADVLVLGFAHISQNQKLYAPIQSPSHIAVRLARD